MNDPMIYVLQDDVNEKRPFAEDQFGYYELSTTIIEGKETRIWQVCDIVDTRLGDSDICLNIIRPSTETWEFRRKGNDEFEYIRRTVENTIKEDHGYSGNKKMTSI